MHKIHLYTTFLTLLCSLSLSAMPRLTVVVVVDGLCEDNLNLLRPFWSKGGLRTLSEEAFYTSVSFPHLVYGGNETTATLLTGTTPDQHGYAMDYAYSRADRKAHHLLLDPHDQGIGTPYAVSPRALLAPTITDEVRMRYGEQAKIYAVGIQPATTLLLAGHAANACCWIDSAQLRWASTSYYPDGLPEAADKQNIDGQFFQVASRIWIPRMDIAMYTYPTEKERRQGFEYQSNKVLYHSPAANTLVINLALALQASEQLGTDLTPDMLMLQLNTLTPKATSDPIHTAEQEDLYLCLNQDLGYLMDQLNKRIGHDQYQLLLVGRPMLGTSPRTMAKAQLPVQQFNVDRAAALIGTYLMAIYGHERWVDGGFGNAIFLNRSLIERKQLSLTDIQRQVANFLMDFEGVQLAFPQTDALLHPIYQTSLNKRFVGDVFFTLQPGWQLMHDDDIPADRVIDNQPKAPVFHWTGSLQPMPNNIQSATDVKKLIQN